MKKLFFIISFFLLFSCNQKEKTHLSDYIPVTKIDSVVIYNNSGEVTLNMKQNEQFISQMEQLTYVCDECYKLGPITANFWIDSKEYILITRTHGNNFELAGPDIVGSPTFTAQNINLDNYK